jgi:hypothetical protein
MVTDPVIFGEWMDEIGAANVNTITHLDLIPSQHLGRFTSAKSIGDKLGDSFGDTAVVTEMHEWISLLQRLAHMAKGIRSLTVYFAADVSGGDSFRYRRGAGECLAFIWAISRFPNLDFVDLQGYYPAQWPSYLTSIWGDRTRVVNTDPSPEHLVWEWRRGTDGLNPRDFGYH